MSQLISLTRIIFLDQMVLSIARENGMDFSGGVPTYIWSKHDAVVPNIDVFQVKSPN